MEELNQEHQTSQRLPRHHHHHHPPSSGSRAGHARSRSKETTTTAAAAGVAEGERFECPGRSCAAALIADCVALCCCPCAVVEFLAFALVKVPWAVGRKCLSAMKRRRRRRRRKKKAETAAGKGGYDDGEGASGVVPEKKGWWVEEGIMEISTSSEEELEQRVWLELYQVGHLGFGRISFTGPS